MNNIQKKLYTWITYDIKVNYECIGYISRTDIEECKYTQEERVKMYSSIQNRKFMRVRVCMFIVRIHDIQLYSKKLAQKLIFCVAVFLPLKSNYEIHFFWDICSLAILHVDHTKVWFGFLSVRIYLIMISSSDLKNHHISTLHYCNKDVRSARDIHHETNIWLRTIYCNINKLKQTNSFKYRVRNSQPRVLSWIG